jgi:anhydro-N-acetylmuramic acid kinase
LRTAYSLSALDYQLLHTAYGHYLGEQVNHFISKYGLDFKVQLIASHGHTVFHMPSKRMTAQIGDGAAIAAETGINVVSDLRSLDVALGGHGAPIVPIGEKLMVTVIPRLMFVRLTGS